MGRPISRGNVIRQKNTFFLPQGTILVRRRRRLVLVQAYFLKTRAFWSRPSRAFMGHRLLMMLSLASGYPNVIARHVEIAHQLSNIYLQY